MHLRYLTRLVAGATGLLVATRAAPAQPTPHDANTPTRRVSAHVLLGGLVPTGAQRRAIGPAALIGAQVAVGLGPALSVVGGAAIAQTTDRRSAVNRDVDLVQVDVGMEIGSGTSRRTRRPITPFGGVGIGGRRYDHEDAGVAARTVFTGYVAAGAELARWRTGLRLEIRDYLSSAGEPAGGVRNELALLAGLGYHFR